MSDVVSVMIVTHNGMPYLRQSVESVLQQTHDEVELVLVDDGSTDDTASFVRDYGNRIVYVEQQRAGIAAARNVATSLATGDYLTFLDSDDLMRPHAVETLLAGLTPHEDLDVVFAHVDEFVSPELDLAARRRLRPPGQNLIGRLPTTMLCRREPFFRVGAFDPSLRRGVTLDWTARALEAGLRSKLLPDVLWDRRLHSRNNGIVEQASTTDYLRVIKSSLDRRRAAATGAVGDDTGMRHG